MMDGVVGWVLIIGSLVAIVGTLLALACGYGDDQ